MHLYDDLNPTAQSHVNYTSSRLSLRKPQRESLERLAYINQGRNDNEYETREDKLAYIQQYVDKFSGFHFDFPSLCFALATGVGKTRLMGAMIYYLHKQGVSNNFFVVAPNLTIYNKLINDFTYGSAKYVFKGLADMDTSTVQIITGENYHSRGGLGYRDDVITINIFNISKFVSKNDSTRMRKMSEYLGESYFDFLTNTKDLVVLMDESHRYRATSSSGALNDLQPLLGLEFTATPQVQSGTKVTKFENIAYEYNLANAIADGYVKIPSVATRENFDSKIDQADLDFAKLTDGVYIHEETKRQLELYAKNNRKPIVKPFMMVSAMNKDHADELEALVKSERFFGGKYADKTIKIYSAQKASELDEAIAQLLEVERSDNPIEIVIQVMMLKEGWDVNNLYTIVPLRTSASDTLTEQTIGRGLRLPYGLRTGVDTVDRLTIVSHDKYDEIVRLANNPTSLVRNVINLDTDSSFGRERQTLENTFIYDQTNAIDEQSQRLADYVQSGTLQRSQAKEIIDDTIRCAKEVVKTMEHLHSSSQLTEQEHKEHITRQVVEQLANKHNTDTGIDESSMQQIVEEVTNNYVMNFARHSIDIPKIYLDYAETSVSFDRNYIINTDFLQGVHDAEGSIRITNLVTNQSETLEKPQVISFHGSSVDYLMKIINEEDIPEMDYGEYNGFLLSVVTTIVTTLQSKFPNKSDSEINQIIFPIRKWIFAHIEQQLRSPQVMIIHRDDPQVKFQKGFTTVDAGYFEAFSEKGVLGFRDTNFTKSDIRNIAFTGFTKCVSNYAKFDSDKEREFSVVIEDSKVVEKWMKPPQSAFKISYYINNEHSYYSPDFVVETADTKYLVEVKASNQTDNNIVLAKSQAATQRCEAVNSQITGKIRQYVLISDDTISISKTFEFLVRENWR